MSNYNTPYDDSFRTMLTDCRRLVIPLVNEMFKENHSGNEVVTLYQNELFITTGNDQKRITDSNFSIGQSDKRYHVECQSSPDGTVFVRIFEYASQIAITTAESDGMSTCFKLPQTGILYLRRSKNIRSSHQITVEAPNGNRLSYEVPTLCVGEYTLDELFEKKLWFLIPFYFFNFPVEEMENDAEKINEMIGVYKGIWNRLDDLVSAGDLSELEKGVIKAMCDKVASALSGKHLNVMKGVETVMGGQVLDYEAKRIAREERIKSIIFMLHKGIDEDEIREMYPDEFDSALDAFRRESSN